MRKPIVALLAVALLAPMLVPGGTASAQVPPLVDCTGPVPDIDPATDPAGWVARDLQNVACGYQRQYDEVTNPAFIRTWAAENAEAFGMTFEQAVDLLTEPMHPRISPTRASMAKITDPFRSADDWEAAGRGDYRGFDYVSKTGTHIRAKIFAPNAGRNLPGLVFSPGLLSFSQVNFWFAESLAEAGYIVLIIDPRGQGDSESLNHYPDGSIDCTELLCGLNVLSNSAALESGIDFLLSTPSKPHPWAVGPNAAGTLRYNPLWTRLNREKIGISGHSLGAIASTPLAQRDHRVSAAVVYDPLDLTIDADALKTAHAPILFFYTDYDFPLVPLPMDPTRPPDPDRRFGPMRQLIAKGVDAMSITPRATAHYDYGRQPFPASFPASRYGELVSLYYTIAWFDRYLKDDPSGTRRLIARVFDASADRHSIGAGTFDANRALSDPFNPKAGNVPYAIAGKCIGNMLSIYYNSGLYLEHGKYRHKDMRHRTC